MKKIVQIALAVVVLSAFASSSAFAQGKKAASKEAAAQSAVSKADAERLVLQRNPGATVLNTNEATVKGQKVWSVSIATTGGNVARKVYVDEATGKLTY
jgi:outer membrane lipoprotein-sorting protein